jgi:hypothetical protein
MGFREFRPWLSRILESDINVICIQELRDHEGWVELLRMESIASDTR